MNMFYTGLGIARSLGEQDIPVIGLSAHRGVYGEYTRYAKIVRCPDSRNEPEALLPFLQKLGQDMGSRAIIFPTRDDDVLFLDHYRQELARYFDPVIPQTVALHASLNKWETYLSAQRAGVPTPRTWSIQDQQDLRRAMLEVTYPCVLKPVESYHWRQGGNWAKVGGRKAFAVTSPEELLAEYAATSRAHQRVLLQEMISGEDDCLVSAACYLDRDSNLRAAFTTQKLAQAPERFGTGFIVQAVERPEILGPTEHLLREMKFTGIAEVEYKWDSVKREYQLIEINPRPWDQHRLGNYCGVDLMHVAYCEHAGLAIPVVRQRASPKKWIAEDTFVMTALRLAWKRDTKKLRWLFGVARGERSYAVWSARDPLPFLRYLFRTFLPGLIGAGVQTIWGLVKGGLTGSPSPQQRNEVASNLEKGKSHG
jgi:predicted ATP-grasp superfamily ATP-dependent carboligase